MGFVDDDKIPLCTEEVFVLLKLSTNLRGAS